jgi:hypothetical protein
MNDSQETAPGIGMKKIEPESVPVRKKKTEEEKLEARRRYNASLKAPESPMMLSTKQAWERLCAKTGCGIAFATFQRWVHDGRVPVIRLGNKIFVPIPIMDDLIEQCLNGHPLI